MDSRERLPVKLSGWLMASSSTTSFESPAQETLTARSEHLELIAATLPLVQAEMSSGVKLGSLLRAEIENWPPPLNDEHSLQWTFERLQSYPQHAGFFSWYVVLVEEHRRLLIGLVGMKGPPDEHGIVEVGYSILEKFQRRGFGSEATLALMHWAFQNPDVKQITAETFPELTPSIRVMERCGMTFLAPGSEPGTIRYGITRETFLGI